MVSYPHIVPSGTGQDKQERARFSAYSFRRNRTSKICDLLHPVGVQGVALSWPPSLPRIGQNIVF